MGVSKVSAVWFDVGAWSEDTCEKCCWSPITVLFSQLFLKEDVFQVLESKRERVRHLAALTLQRYVRMYFVRKNFCKFRENMTKLQARGKGFLAR